MKKLGLGMIGTGLISAAFVSAVRKTDAFEVVSVYSRSIEQGTEFARKNQIPNIKVDLDDFLQDPMIDVVYIASPNDLHYPQAKRALLAGKDVISEKPMVSTQKEMDDLVRTMSVSGKYVVEAITSRHVPNLEVLRTSLPRIGNVKLIRSDMSQYSSRFQAFINGEVANVFSPDHSGGALYDIGIYPVSLMISLFGAPDSVAYQANIYPNGIDGSGVMTMNFKDKIAVCTFSKDSYGPNSTIIEGESGYIQIEGTPSRIKSLTLVKQGVAEELGLSQEDEMMVYEASEFATLFSSRNQEKLDELTRHSLILSRVMEEGRRQAGIRFKADDRVIEID